MRMDPTIKPKKELPVHMNRKGLLAIGLTLIGISVIALGLSLFESFWHGGGVQMIEVPGFHELKLDTPGLYAGIYQHRGSGELPIQALAHLDVRVMSKGAYEEIPVLVNTSGQTFDRFGIKGMPVFNFVIENPGVYTLSAVYNDNHTGPALSVFVIPQSAQNVKQTLIVGIAFSILFLVAGVFVLIKMKKWAPQS